MKLSTNILANRLKRKFTLQNKKALSDELHLERVLYYCDGEEMEPHKIYICSGGQVQSLELIVPEDAVLFAVGKVRTRNTGQTGQVFQIIDEVSPFSLFNEIQRIFDYYQAWDDRLYELTGEDGAVRKMLDESFHIFHNPIVIHTADYFVVDYSSVIDTRQELGELVDPDVIFERNRENQDLSGRPDRSKKKGAYFYPDFVAGTRSLCVNIFENDRYAYRMVMAESISRFEAYDGALLEHLARHISHVVSSHAVYHSDMGYRLDRILSDILNDVSQDEEMMRQSFAEFGWKADHRYLCLVLKVASTDLENMTARFLCNHLENMVENSSVFQHKGNITAFVNLTRFGGDSEDVKDRIIFFLRDSFLKVGFSNEFVGFGDLQGYYNQALAALETGMRSEPYKWVHRFDDTALQYMLEHAKGAFPARLVCSRKIMELREFDHEHNTEYYRTLECYIRNRENAVRTAKQLYIHRSTFLYRMDKIKELTKLNLEDYDTLLYVMMTFRMLEKEQP